MAFGSCVLTLVLLYVIPVEPAFRYEDCSTQDSIISLTTFNILPDPIDLAGNLTVNITGQIFQDIPESTLLEVKYYSLRKVFGMQLEIRIPCLLGKYGSCALPFCDYIERFKKQVCPFFSNEIDCRCPLTAGNYSREGVEIEMAKPSIITRLLVSGRYRTEMKLKDAESSEEIACFKFYTELT